MYKSIIPIIAATGWISLSEFFRNEVLVKSLWVAHYRALGLTFPDAPINGAVWGVWSLAFATFVYLISKKYDARRATLVAWFAAFPLMWISLGDLGILPLATLWAAVPLSLLETFVAVLIIKKLLS